MLIEIADVDGFPEFQGPSCGRSPACNEIEQGGLPAAIGANDADPVLGAEAVGEVSEKRASLDLTIGGDTDTLCFDDQFPDAAAHTGHFKFPPGLKRFFVPHGFDPLQSSLLLGTASLRPLSQPGKLPAQHPFELGRRGGFRGFLLRLVLEISAVVPLVSASPPPVHFHHPAGDAVQHIAVMGHKNEGSWIAVEPALQPFHGLGIQMVRWLIQQENIWACNQC